MVSLLDRVSSLALITKFVTQVFPLVNTELRHWQKYVQEHAAGDLAKQALDSLRDKKFHCQGGSIFSLYPAVNTVSFIRLVVALQTISDYLDNLCDRAGVTDERSFRQLHLAISDALDPQGKLHDYYTYYPSRNDGGYLDSLVTTCQQEIQLLPSYELVKQQVLRLAQLYCDLQIYKHLDPKIREQHTSAWANAHLTEYPELSKWEFAAASGSTLGLFILCAIAADPSLTSTIVQKIRSAYFPWICGLHILLDYFIDQDEDRRTGDLNFIAYYKDDGEILSRLTYFSQQSFFCARELSEPAFTETVVHGLLALYLSDPKTLPTTERHIKTALLKAAGGHTKFIYALCRLLRSKRIL